MSEGSTPAAEMEVQAEVAVSPPKGVDEEKISAAEEEAAALALQVASDPGDRKLMRSLSTIGYEAEDRSNAEIGLLRKRMGAVMDQLSQGGSDIPKNLMALRTVMDEMNPQIQLDQLTKPSGWKAALPGFLRKAPVIGDILGQIAIKYQSIQDQIDAIVGGLKRGQDMLLQDTVELETLYEKVRVLEKDVLAATYKGQFLWKTLDEKKAQASDPAEANQLDKAIGKVAVRVQDLKTMEQVFLQFYGSIDLTLDNNDSLSDSIRRTVTVTRNVLEVGLALQVALANQKQVAEAVKATREYTGQMLAANAAALKQQTTDIARLQTDPVLALEHLQSAYNDLMEAMDKTDEIRKEGTEKARQGIEQLDQMSGAMRERLGRMDQEEE